MDIKNLGEMKILDSHIFELGENIFTGSGFLPTLGDANANYNLCGNFKVTLEYDSKPEKKIYSYWGNDGNCRFDFSPVLDMPEKVLNAGLLYLMYPNMQTFDDKNTNQLGWSQPIITTTSESLFNNGAPFMYEDLDYVSITDRTGTLGPVRSGVKLEGIVLHGEKEYTIMQDGTQRSPRAVSIASVGYSSVTYNHDSRIIFSDAITGSEKVIWSDSETGIGVLYNVGINVEIIKWDPVVGYVITEKIIYCNLIFSCRYAFDAFNHNLLFNELNSDLVINSFRVGTEYTNTESHISVIDYQEPGTLKACFYFGYGGLGVYYELLDYVVQKFYWIGIADVTLKNIQAGTDFGLYPYSSGANQTITGVLSVSKQGLESIEPLISGENQKEYFLSDDTFADLAQVALFTDGPYGVVVGMDKDGISYAVFILRNGAGYYTLKLDSIVPLNGWVEYGSYKDEVLTIGYYPSIDDYPDPIADPPLLKYALITIEPIPVPVQKIELDFRKFIISFIPCQTHCMAKGGIVSKIY